MGYLRSASPNSIVGSKLPWLAAMAIFMQALDATILNTAIPTIAYDLNHSPLEMQFVVVSYALTLALFIPLSGWLSDRYGTKRIFSIAILIFILGSLACAMSVTFNQLVCSRIMQAIGGSMMVPVSRLALLYTYPKDKLLSVMNFVTMPGLVGPLVGPLLGGWLVDIASWHWIFIINIPIGIIGLIATQYVMPNYKRPNKKLDFIGFVLFSIGLISLSLFLEIVTNWSMGDTNAIVLLIIFFIFGSFYFWYSRRISNPIVDFRLFRINTLKIGILGNLCTRLGIGSIPYLLPQMLQIAFLRSSVETGAIMMVSALTTILAKSKVVSLVERFGYKKVLVGNTIILAFIISLFALPDKSTPIIFLVPVLAMYGFVNSVQLTSMNTISLADLTSEVASAGNSMLAITQQLSMSFGISVGALILSTTQSTEWMTGNNVPTSFKYTFIILGAITLISSLVFRNLKDNDGDQILNRRD